MVFSNTITTLTKKKQNHRKISKISYYLSIIFFILIVTASIIFLAFPGKFNPIYNVMKNNCNNKNS